MAFFGLALLATVFFLTRRLFKRTGDTTSVSVEFWVVMTTMLLLLKFLVGSIRTHNAVSMRFLGSSVSIVQVLSYSATSYTLGLMQLSRDPNDFFQVWAVLVVTMQYSVKVGRPYRDMQISVLDLLSSLWAANLLRSWKRGLGIMIPLWVIWFLNGARIIAHTARSSKAPRRNTNNIRLISDYMRMPQHTTFADANPITMVGYMYFVLGEEEHDMILMPPNSLELVRPHRKGVITLERIWGTPDHDSTLPGRSCSRTSLELDNRHKDVCLSFALYKLLRRRFFHMPIPEAKHPGMRRLVFEAILEDTSTFDRAFRVTEVELGFLCDMFYSKHELVFAKGFPWLRLLTSAMMVVTLGYVAMTVRYVSDSGAGTVRHGVLVTRTIIAIMFCKELYETWVYVFSQWTILHMMCWYATLQEGLMRGLTRNLARVMFRLVSSRGRWDQKIRQYNLLVSARSCSGRLHMAEGIVVAPAVSVRVKLRNKVKRALFNSLKGQGMDMEEDNLKGYFEYAFGDRLPLVRDLLSALTGETHKILVWHVATSLCEITLQLDQAPDRRDSKYDKHQPFVSKSTAPAAVWPHYITAACISNYCAYLVTQALLPDNRLVASRVFEAVRDEAATILRGCSSLVQVRDALMPPAAGDGDHLDLDGMPIVKRGAQLAKQLIVAYGADKAALWGGLSKFWTGFLLHLSASTKAAKHKRRLLIGGELTTHLWTLLSHAGFLGTTKRGHEALDELDDIYDDEES